jgi:hypothetical protein
VERSRLLSLTPPGTFYAPEPVFPGAGVVLPLWSLLPEADGPLGYRDAPFGVAGTASPYC